jgi:uncharacterized membrane protein
MEIIRHKYRVPNVGKVERAASFVAGALMVSHGLRRMTWRGAGLAFLGTAFIRRGITGFCYTYRELGINTARTGGSRIPYELGVRVDEAVTINRPRHEVYRFWRNLENLAEFLEHVESVRAMPGDLGSHWVARGPGGRRIEWDAEIVNEVENELLAWRSIEGTHLPNAGSVRFVDTAGGRGTEVRVSLQYDPPGGNVAALVAKLFGEDPSNQIRNDLKRLKTRLETGEIPTVEGQPAGGRKADEARENHRKSEKILQASEASFPASDAPAYTH